MPETTEQATAETFGEDSAEKRLRIAELQAERAKVVIESLAGFCHSLGQPATVLLSSIELLRMQQLDPQSSRQILDMCFEAVIEIRNLLGEMKKKREYVAEAYLAGNKNAGTMLTLPDWKDTPRASWDRPAGAISPGTVP